MEILLHYVWKHKMFPLSELTTTDGRTVEVVDPGRHNSDSGPDFFNAKVKIDGTLWVGNVEIHDRASDWYLHGHDHDRAYNNVVLHVAETIDRDICTSDGRAVVQMQLSVPQSVRNNYEALLSADRYPPCYKIVPHLSTLFIHSWMAALQAERMERKTEDIQRRADAMEGSWEDAYFVTLARNYGFGINGETFEQWALNVPLSKVGHHRDDLFQIESIFMGQAGLLTDEAIPHYYISEAHCEGYYDRLRNEYQYLAHKFNLKPIDYKLWRFLRLRPQNFPHIRISQLANLYYERRAGLSVILECKTLEQLRTVMQTHVTPYWETHYTFGSTSTRNEKNLSPASMNLLMINTAVPMLFAYGRHIDDERYCERAIGFLEQLRAENNNIVRMWRDCGLSAQSAGDSQALIQLKNEYCDRKECLRCRIGYEYLKEN